MDCGTIGSGLAPVGAGAFSPRQAATAAPPWVIIIPKTAVAPAEAKAVSKASFRPCQGDDVFGGLVTHGGAASPLAVG
ncbi:MAG: hypothetical protein FWD61_08860 [Phycisphaerales bacterium]|nr:hypothetical protein [Phycisphaerales bacterium]